MPAPRLYTDQPLAKGTDIALTDAQAHYLGSVMRRKVGDTVVLFNGRDGEWIAHLATLSRRGGTATPDHQSREQMAAPDLWLLFAPLKKARMDMVVEKATELGVAALVPVLTERTNAERVRPDRLERQIIEAAEQTERLDLPALMDAQPLFDRLRDWPAGRTLVYFDETGSGAPAADVLTKIGEPAALLVGPEGGFAQSELDGLANLAFSVPASLGPRILRAETAALAGLALWQALSGDGKNKPPVPV